MTVTAADLTAYVGAQPTDGAFVAACWSEAEALVSAYVGTAKVPSEVLSRASLEVGSELFHRRSAPNGVAQFGTLDGAAPIRVARDPMVGAYPLLARYVSGGFA